MQGIFLLFFLKNPLMTKLNILILCCLHFSYISTHQHVLIMLLLSFIIVIVVNDFFLDGNFLSKFNLKNMILIYTKNISSNETPKIAKFQILFFPNHQKNYDNF
jgi:hypothetical protein